MPTNAIVLAAGEGTRMKSNHAKVAHTILGKPLVWWTVNACQKAGAERIFVVVGAHADEVRSCLSDMDNLIFIEQTEQLGTGHAVKCVCDAVDTFDGPVMICYGDSPLIKPESLAAMAQLRRENKAAAALLTMCPPDPTGYGRILLDEKNTSAVAGIVEEKDCTPEQRKIQLANAGVYVCCGRRLKTYISELSNNNAQHEYYLTDMVDVYRAHNELVLTYAAADYTEALGVNSRAQLATATKLLQRRINEAHLAEGVTMWDPEQVWIGPEVTIGRDTELLPQTYLLGTTSVGENNVIGPNTRLTNMVVGNNNTLEELVALDSTIDDSTSIGPRAYIRPGTHIMNGAHVGTHVEIKKSTIGEGSKVPHLSYIGDTTMGSGVNIGAGSITCNYDGVNKHKTTIGNNVFIGSDTMMVAPVTIGDDALVGASSCITKNVPADALALERSEQRIVEGYASKRRARLLTLKKEGKN